MEETQLLMFTSRPGGEGRRTWWGGEDLVGERKRTWWGEEDTCGERERGPGGGGEEDLLGRGGPVGRGGGPGGGRGGRPDTQISRHYLSFLIMYSYLLAGTSANTSNASITLIIKRNKDV